MSSGKIESIRLALRSLKPDQIAQVTVDPPTIESLYEYVKAALDEDCYTSLQGITLMCRKLRPVDETDFPGLAFAVPAFGDPRIIETSIGASPAVSDPRNELYTLWDQPAPKNVIDLAREKTSKEWIVFAHHDLYIPKNWAPRMWRAVQEAERQFGPIGVAGVFGVWGDRRVQRHEAGAILDQHGTRTLVGPWPLPAKVRTLDGCVLMFRKDSGIVPDPELGWHFYDADMCLQAAEKNLKVVAVESWLLHRSNWREPDAAFKASEEIFRRKRASALPMEVPCTLVV